MSKKTILSLLVIATFLFTSCSQSAKEQTATEKNEIEKVNVAKEQIPNTAEQIMVKPQVPVLCYHRISDGKKGDYTVSLSTLTEQLTTLSDSGYHSILPDQLYNYLVFNDTLPKKPFMITFDDSREEHITLGASELEKLGFRAAFFIMTITYNKKNYMTTAQIADLAKRGHTIGLHSWDHTMVTKYTDSIDWQKQIILPKKKLREITGKEVEYFAYPNGVYNHISASELTNHFNLSFSLASKRDSLLPLQCVRRIIAPECTGQRLIKSMKNSF